MKIKIYAPSFGAVLAALTLLWLNSGFFVFIRKYLPSFLMYGVFALWFLISINRQRGIWDRIKENVVPLIPSLLLFGAGTIAFKNRYANTYLMYCVYTIFILLICDYYQDKESDFIFLYRVWIADSVFVGIKTLIVLKSSPNIIRIMSTGILASSKYGLDISGVAGFSGIVAYIFFSLLLLNKVLNRSTLNKWKTIVLFAFFEIIIFKSRLGILVLINILGILIIWAVAKLNNKRNRTIAIILIIVIGFTLWNLLPFLLSYISNSPLFSNLIRSKAMDLTVILSGGEGLSENTFSRLDKYDSSVSSFLTSPILGGIATNAEVGGHATWLDLLGLFGLLSLFFFKGMVSILYSKIKTIEPEAEKNVLTTILVLYLALGFVDPILFQNVMIVFTMGITYLYDYSPKNCSVN